MIWYSWKFWRVAWGPTRCCRTLDGEGLWTRMAFGLHWLTYRRQTIVDAGKWTDEYKKGGE